MQAYTELIQVTVPYALDGKPEQLSVLPQATFTLFRYFFFRHNWQHGMCLQCRHLWADISLKGVATRLFAGPSIQLRKNERWTLISY